MKPLQARNHNNFNLSLILVACGGATEETSEEEVVVEEVTETLDSPAVTTAGSVKTGVGITEEACPEVISNIPTGADPTKGCIYLGMLNDYSGPYELQDQLLILGKERFGFGQTQLVELEITVWQSEKDLMRHTIHKNI